MTFRRAAIVLTASLLVAACDHGAMLVADNRSDQDLLARAVGTTYGSDGGYQPTEIVVVVPANKRLVIAELPFGGGFRIQRVDILAPDCTEVGTLSVHGEQGTVVEIADDLTVRLRDEFPQSGERADTTDQCHEAPSAAPSTTFSPSP
jgi:hypothetical protein